MAHMQRTMAMRAARRSLLYIVLFHSIYLFRFIFAFCLSYSTPDTNIPYRTLYDQKHKDTTWTNQFWYSTVVVHAWVHEHLNFPSRDTSRVVRSQILSGAGCFDSGCVNITSTCRGAVVDALDCGGCVRRLRCHTNTAAPSIATSRQPPSASPIARPGPESGSPESGSAQARSFSQTRSIRA